MTRQWDIPTSWEWTVIKQLGDVFSGGTPSTRNSDYWGGNVIWFSPSDLTGYKSKYISRGAKTLTNKGLSKSSAKVMPAGSIMFSSRAPVGYVAINSQPSATNQGFKSIAPHPELFNEYIYYYLKVAKHIAETRATGTTFKELSRSAFGELPIPIAPANEQRRIVEKIEELFNEVDRGVHALQAAKSTLDLYRKSLLKSAFEGRLTADWRAQNLNKLESPDVLIGRIREEREAHYQVALEEWRKAVTFLRANGQKGKKPAKPKRPRPISRIAHEKQSNKLWPRVELGDIISVKSGRGLTSKQFRSGLYPVYGGNGFNGYHDQYFLEVAELIIGRVGANCGVTHVTQPKSWVTDNALIVTPLVESFNKRLFKLLLEFHDLNALASSTGQPVISGSKIYSVVVNLPTLAEQIEMVRILDFCLDTTERLDAEIDATLTRADTLRQSILKKAFAGHLVPQDPTDEPASTLLVRIQSEGQSANKNPPRKVVSS